MTGSNPCHSININICNSFCSIITEPVQFFGPAKCPCSPGFIQHGVCTRYGKDHFYGYFNAKEAFPTFYP